MGERSEPADPRVPGPTTDPWTVAPAPAEPARWWRAPAAVLLGAGGLALASGSVRQAVTMAVVAGVVAAAARADWRPSPASAALRLGAVAAAGVVARPFIGGRQLLLVVLATGLACLALGAWGDRRRAPPALVPLAIAPLVASQIVAGRGGADLALVALLVLGAALLALGALRPGALDRADHVVGHAVRAVATVVGAVILFPVVLVCLYLPGLLVRLAQVARSASGAGDAAVWQPYGVGPDDERADAPRPFASTPRRLRTRRHLLGAGLVAVVALVAGTVVVRSHRSPSEPTGLTLTRPRDQATDRPAARPGSGASSSKRAPFAAELSAPYSSLPAYQGVTWADELQRQEGNDPEISERWVNVHDSVRASLPAPDCACKQLKIWFVGGSAAFGYGQRDQHTIAADLVRIGAESGISIDMDNLGRAGTTLPVEVQQIESRLEREPAPDLIVFMDGFNDGLFSTAFAFGDSEGTDDRAELDGLGAIEYMNDNADTYLTSSIGRAAGTEALGYLRPLRRQMDDLARSRGIATAWFFQPDAFVNPLQLKGYDAVTNVAPEEFTGSPLATALEVMADGLADDGVIDLRPLFRHYPRPVFLGVVHQSEEGAAITADAIYDHLEDQIERLAS